MHDPFLYTSRSTDLSSTEHQMVYFFIACLQVTCIGLICLLDSPPDMTYGSLTWFHSCFISVQVDDMGVMINLQVATKLLLATEMTALI